MKTKSRKAETRLVHLGRDPKKQFGAVNPPVVRASTFIMDTLTEFENRKTKDRRKGEYSYGRLGTPTTVPLETAIADLEGAADCFVSSSGAAAIGMSLMTALKSGDHLLIIDCCYAPARAFADTVLTRMGVEVTYFDPLIGAGIEKLIKPNTRAIYLETPGSLTFEMPDLPAFVEVAKRHDIITIVDNTWASPLGLQPIKLGIDMVVHAGTKHICGHSDAMLGLVSANEKWAGALRHTHYMFGQTAGSEEAYLALRGLRTMALRLERSTQTAMTLARWLQDRPEVARVLYPPLPQDPGHAIWKRDFTGACGLFSIVLAKQAPREAFAAMIEGYELFALGASWGGYESLVLHWNVDGNRTAVPWQAPGQVVRFAIGLEDPDDLRADIEAGFARLKKAGG